MGFTVKHIDLYLNRHMSPVCYDQIGCICKMLAHFKSVIFGIYTIFFVTELLLLLFSTSRFSCSIQGFDDFITIMCVHSIRKNEKKKIHPNILNVIDNVEPFNLQACE